MESSDYSWVDLLSERVLRELSEFAFVRGALVLVDSRGRSTDCRELLVWMPTVGEIRISISVAALVAAVDTRRFVLLELSKVVDQLRAMQKVVPTPVTLQEASQLRVTLEDLQNLLEYCKIHCRTERALFHVDQIRRVAELADAPHDLPTTGFVSVGPDVMDPMVAAAQAKLDSQPKEPIDG